MAYDDVLADRVRERLASSGGVTERKMFGGLAFLTNGHMIAGVYGDDLWVRIAPEDLLIALMTQPGARPYTVGERPPAKDCLYVAGEVLDDDALDHWLADAWEAVLELPPK
ncbi:TfoX/Sxy family protein [Nocardia sp. NPDC049149]|uniref:TfoX/Sxy family protein n=1 Tax=Nocardia sp. NPDC049149 TaxID=3364315 RepID=UPI00371CAB87